MKSWTIKNRLSFLALLPAVCIAIFLTLYFSLRLIGNLDRDIQQRGSAIANNLALSAEDNMNPGNRLALLRLARNALSQPDVMSLRITDIRGDTLFEEKRSNYWNSSPAPFVQFVSNLVNRNEPMTFQQGIIRENIRNNSETKLGVVSIAMTTEPTNYKETVITLTGIGIVAVILGIATLFAFYTSRSISTPLEKLNVLVSAIQQGHFEARVPVTSGGEIGDLEYGVNQMAEKIEGLHKDMSQAIAVATSELNHKIAEINETNTELEMARMRAEDVSLAKSRFLANMSHELRTPMNSIVGFTDLISEYKVDAAHNDYVSTIARSAADLLILINEILDYSKIESGELKIDKCEFNLYELVDDIISLLSKSAYEKNIDFLLYIDPNIPTIIHSDPLRIKQAIINLLSNAIKFTNMGYVALEISLKKGGDHPEGYYEFKVIDTGIGIADKEKRRIFDPFTQADDSLSRQTTGTGLGLSIAKYFIEKLGGGIRFESKTNVGSTFTFTIPYVDCDATPYYLQNPLDSHSVLIYDRNEKRAEYTENMLTTWGLKPTTTSTIEKFMKELPLPKHKLVFYFLNQNNIDTDLQISINHIPDATDATIVFLHNDNYYEDLSSATNFLHFSNIILPNALYSAIIEEIANEPPAADTETSPITRETGIHRLQNLEGITVLLADDNEINQHLLEVYITRNDGVHVVARDGEEAINAVENHDIDIVIMDVHMPNIDGLQATAKIKSKHPDLPIIAVTADANPENLNNYLKSGFNACLTKPVIEKKLIMTILEALTTPGISNQDASSKPSRESSSDKQMKIVNIEKAIKISGGNKQLSHELYKMLVADLKTKRSQLATHYEKLHFKEIKEIAHKIHGGAKYCAAEKLQFHASKVESAINEDTDGKYVGRLLEQLSRAITEILALDNPYT